MCEVRLDIPESSVEALAVPREAIGAELRLLAAMKAYELDRLSAGAAADLAGIGKVEFLHKLKDFNIDVFRTSPDDFERDQDALERSLGG